MCIFSVPPPSGLFDRLLGPRVQVSQTKIFARMVASGVQGIAYAMHASLKQDLAMVLPLPVRPHAGEQPVRFIDLRPHAAMFDELDALFDVTSSLDLELMARGNLPVYHVGSFIASYVPSRFDFDRLDRRFQLPRHVVEHVPLYKDYGFAVFQLKAEETVRHPMAFTFPTREIERLYFPTVHWHDGRFHDHAAFDHELYYQHPRVRGPGGTFETDPVSTGLPTNDYAALVDITRPLIRRTLRGKLPNQDTWIACGRPITVNP